MVSAFWSKACLSVLLIGSCYGFYLPGIAKVSYSEGAPIEVYADRMTSTKSQLPFEYFSLPFCRTAHQQTLRSQHLNIGELLLGERNQLTDYQVNMLVSETCKICCRKTFTAQEVKLFAKRVKQDYSVRLNLDNMPGVLAVKEAEAEYYFMGVPLGRFENGTVYLFNHLSFVVRIHEPSLSHADLSSIGFDNVYRVVGFEVRPHSVQHEFNEDGSLRYCPLGEKAPPKMVLDEVDPKGQEIVFTYDVDFVKDEVLQWATRWDPLLKASPEYLQLQKYYIFNSLAITLFLTFLVGIILTRTVYLDYARYNSLDNSDEVEAESGWKQVHGDVFRAPQRKELLVIAVGSGAQIFLITVITISFALLGFWSPAYRGGLLTALIFLWILTSMVSGYTAAWLYTEMGGTNRKVVTTGSAMFFSSLMFVAFFTVNLVFWFARSSAAVNFYTLVALLFAWLILSVPISVLGSFIGYRQKKRDQPCQTNAIPREIPEYAPVSPFVFCVISGIMPFGVVFVELALILDSLWQNNIYYMFGFLFAVFVLLTVTCVEVSMVITYLQLSKEDYRWWWTSFLSSGSSGLYVLLYSCFYLLSQRNLRQMHLGSVIMYASYSSLISLGFGLMAGAVGFLSSRLFVRRMFSSVRTD